MSNGGIESKAQREPKANVLMNRMLCLEDVINRTCKLRDIVEHGRNHDQDGPEVENKTTLADCPSISAVLDTGPEILQSHYNRMMDLLEQLEERLL